MKRILTIFLALSLCMAFLPVNTGYAAAVNLALNKPVFAPGSTQTVYIPSRINNGNIDYWASNPYSGSTNPANDNGRSIYIDLGGGADSTVTFDKVVLKEQSATPRTQNFRLQVCNSNPESESSWTTFFTEADEGGMNPQGASPPRMVINDFGILNARYIRLYIDKALNTVLISELEVYNTTGLVSSGFYVHTEIMTISVPDNLTQTSDLLAGLQLNPAAGGDATISVCQADGVTPAGATFDESCKVVVKETGADGTVNSYSIEFIDPGETIESDVYKTNHLMRTITNIPYSDRAVDVFLSNVSVSPGATLTLYKPDGVTLLTGTEIYTGCIAEVEKGGSVNRYTLSLMPPSSLAELNSNIFTINREDQTIEVSFLYDMLEVLLSRLILPPGAMVRVENAEGFEIGAGGTVTSGCKVISTAEDGVTTVTYTILITEPAQAAGVASLKYTVDDTNGVISNVSFYDRAVGKFKSNITALPGADYEVYFSDGKTPAVGNLYTGCKLLVFTGVTSKTYEIRINETVFIPGVNLAMNKNVITSGDNASYPKANLVDGGATSYWVPSTTDGSWAQIDVGGSDGQAYFDRIILRERADVVLRLKRYTLQRSDDGITWDNIAVVDDDSGVGRERIFNFPVTKARYVRIVNDRCFDDVLQKTISPYLGELEIYLREQSDAYVSSSKYIVDDELRTVWSSGQTSISTFLADITPSPGGSLRVVNASGDLVTGGEIMNGYRLIVTAKSGISESYSIITDRRLTVQSLTVSASGLNSGDILSASVQYDNADISSVSKTVCHWLLSDTPEGPFVPVVGGNSNTYCLRQADVGKYISVRAEPYSSCAPQQGVTAFSDWMGFVGSLNFGCDTLSSASNAAYAVDSRMDTVFSFSGQTRLVLDLKEKKALNRIMLNFNNPQNSKKYRVSYSDDAKSWQTIFTRECDFAADDIFFDDVQKRYIMIESLSSGAAFGLREAVLANSEQSDEQRQSSLAKTKALLESYFQTRRILTDDVVLSAYGVWGAKIAWTSSDASVLAVNGEIGVVNRPSGENENVSLTATIVNGASTLQVQIPLAVKGLGQGGDTPGGSGGRGGNGSVIKIQPPTPETIAQETKPGSDGQFFKDTQEHWAAEYINRLYEIGIVSGNTDGSFEPDRHVLREEFVKMLVNAAGLSTEGAEAAFADVHPDAWYYPYIAAALKNKIAAGGGDGLFGIGSPITRQDMAVMLDNTLVVLYAAALADGAADFSDMQDCANYAVGAIERLTGAGILNGRDGRFAPAEFLTRGEAAKVIAAMLDFVK